jgi:hypothetical protein
LVLILIIIRKMLAGRKLWTVSTVNIAWVVSACLS